MPLHQTSIKPDLPDRTLQRTVSDIQEHLRHGRELLERMRTLTYDIAEQLAKSADGGGSLHRRV
jgi:hypothetical protein